MLLKDKIALVTGSTHNIGLGIARAFAREGAKVIVHSRHLEDAKKIDFDDAARCQQGILRLLDVALHDGELVPSQECDGVHLADAGLQPLGHRAKQFVADRVTERVIDLFKVVEIN